MIDKKILDFQNIFFERLNKKEASSQIIHIPKLIQSLQEYEDDIIQLGLGDTGKKLKEFLNVIDFNHPGLNKVFDGILEDDQEFSKVCSELLSLAKVVKDENLSYLSPIISQILCKEFNYKNIIRKIDIPINNRMNVRLLKTKEEREEIRSFKKMQTIDLQGLYKKGEDVWLVQPSSFNCFLRFDTAYRDDLKKAEKKLKRYEELGCLSLAEGIKKSIEVFCENMEQSYYGFNRITMTNAAVILAKSLGFSYVSSKTADGLFEKAKITVSKKFFDKYNFDPIAAIEYNPYVSGMAGTLVFNEKQDVFYDYEPRIYPLHEFLDIASEGTKQSISLLESFPDAGNKPIFDHFGIIVPGINFPLNDKNNQVYTFLDKSGLVRSYLNREDAVKNLDKVLVKEKYIHPIILGEYDGKAYFISYWT